MTSSMVDTHAHVFRSGLPLTSRRRYAPKGEAPVAVYLALLDAHGVGAGVLVQPSFFGTDNRHLVESLGAAPDRLRGIAVVAPDVDDRTLDAYAAAGVVGIRLNLLGDDPGKLRTAPWRELARRVSDRGWQIEIQAEGRDLPGVLDSLMHVTGPLVVDHFGRPDPLLGVGDPGFRRVLAHGRDGQLWVKLSGPYRCGGADVRPYAQALLSALGPGRLLWGSDWPWTNFEGTRTYADGVGELACWCSDEERRLLAEGARRLFRLPPA